MIAWLQNLWHALLRTPHDLRPMLGVARSGQWPAVRKAWLEAYPSCARCGGTDHVEVHHCEPFSVNPDRELDRTNFLTLCMHPTRQCHWQAGHFAESWSVFNPDVRTDAAKFRKGREEAKKPKLAGNVSPLPTWLNPPPGTHS